MFISVVTSIENNIYWKSFIFMKKHFFNQIKTKMLTELVAESLEQNKNHEKKVLTLPLI
jgi:hypothetical protein